MVTAETHTFTHEQFLETLYERSYAWLEEHYGLVIAEFLPQEVERWTSYTDGPRSPLALSAQIIKGAFGTVTLGQRLDWALVLSRRCRWSHSDPTLCWQFGFLPEQKPLPPSNNPKVNELRSLVYPKDPIERVKCLCDQGFFTYGSGEIYIHPMVKRMSTNCWASSSIFGGPNLRSWSDEKFLTEKGIQASLSMMNLVATRAFLT